ncbi:MBL fold metallo-hydrolase [Streptomyces sp. NPDC006872]|uniref:MBL fold metallo-hydrolase n=1 Tax=Streptomyces sp. NPDC006872 TaxID=3155720 RepID=UPI0034034873
MTLLVDCGATSLVAMRQQGLDPAEVDAVVASHLHGDHFCGIPFLILQAERLEEPRKGPAQGRSRPRRGHRCPP